MVRRRLSLQEAGEALVWPLIHCDNSMVVSLSQSLQEVGLGGRTLLCARTLPGSGSADRQREGAVISVGMCSHKECQECGVKRYLKSCFTFRREALWVCLGQLILLS